jgi:hypothetical protein
MPRLAAVPFGLPGLAGERRPLLWWPQLAVLAGGVLLVPFSLVILLHPQIDHAFAKREIPAYQHAFGFEVGQVPNDLGGTYWGFTRVTRGGAADRAGLRADDVIFTFHGTPAFTLRWAIDSALTGQEACFRVVNMRDAGVYAERTVCLARPQPPAS